jgi:hypothetical protein
MLWMVSTDNFDSFSLHKPEKISKDSTRAALQQNAVHIVVEIPLLPEVV